MWVQLCTSHKCFRIQKIRVHQAGVEHPNKEHHIQLAGDLWISCRRQVDFCPPGVIRRKFPKTGPPQPATKGRVIFMVRVASAIGQTAMMSHDSERRPILPDFAALKRACGGMVHTLGRSVEPLLKGVRVFPQVVGQSGQFSLFLRAESGGELGA